MDSITDTQAAGIHEFLRDQPLSRASGPQFLQRDCTSICHEQPAQKSNDPQFPSLTRRPSASQLSWTRLSGTTGGAGWVDLPTTYLVSIRGRNETVEILYEIAS